MLSVNRYLQWSVWMLTDEDGKLAQDVEMEKGVTSGRRPVLIISNNVFNSNPRNNVVNVLKMTRTLNSSPVHVECRVFDYAKSHIQCEQAHTVGKYRLQDFRGMLDEATVTEVKKAMMFQYGMVNDFNLTGPALDSVKNFIDDYILHRSAEFEAKLKEMFIPGLVQNAQTALDGMFDNVISTIVSDTIKKTEDAIERQREQAMKKAADDVAKALCFRDEKTKKGLTDDEKRWCIDNYKIRPEEVMNRYGWTSSTLTSNISKFRKHLRECNT